MTRAIQPIYPENAKTVRATIRSERRIRGIWVPLGILALNYAVFIGSFVGIVALPNWPVKLLLIVVNGHVIGTLFTIGHEDGHGSFTRSRFLNGLVGHLAFLPSLTPLAPWRYIHNYLHHSFTNCKDKDFVWRPLSVAEYNALPRHQRWLERTYRTIPGLPLNWIIENWLSWLLFPNRPARTAMAKWGSPNLDRLIVCAWFMLELAAVGGLTWLVNRPATIDIALRASVVNLVCCITMPFLIWCTLMSYVDLLQHTHPAIRWFSSSSEPAFTDTQLEGTTRIVYPSALRLIYHNIMEHTAHHVDPSIPMYHLYKAQNDLVAEHPGRIVIEFFSFTYLFPILRTCKLYDYANHRWVGFDGLPIPAESKVAAVDSWGDVPAFDSEVNSKPS